jgi:hypothetical protein
MPANSDLNWQSWIQRNVLWLAGVVFLGSLSLYFFNFNGPLSPQQSTWGEFGDFMGGVVNPIIGLCTVWLLTVSLKQNQIALQQARDELGLAREALESAKDMQERTEQALQKQIDIADQTRDMANSVALWNHMFDKGDVILKQIKQINVRAPGNQGKVEQLDAEIREAKRTAGNLDRILQLEVNRLLAKYSP